MKSIIFLQLVKNFIAFFMSTLRHKSLNISFLENHRLTFFTVPLFSIQPFLQIKYYQILNLYDSQSQQRIKGGLANVSPDLGYKLDSELKTKIKLRKQTYKIAFRWFIITRFLIL